VSGDDESVRLTFHRVISADTSGKTKPVDRAAV